jgi:hypothetical protein
MVMALVGALTAVFFGQLDLAAFDPVHGADMHAVSADDFHVFLDTAYTCH